MDQTPKYPEAVRLSSKRGHSICSLLACSRPTAYRIVEHPDFPPAIEVPVAGSSRCYRIWVTREVLKFRDEHIAKRSDFRACLSG